jgi:arabinose-5-phosphate isomerase
LKTTEEIKSIAKSTIEEEGKAVLQLLDYVGDEIAEVVQLLLNSKGRLIVTGIGKSANIAQKLVATFNSTGQPAVFMHAADAIHGDLGNIQKEDVVLCISKSGNTPEIKTLLPMIRTMGNKLFSITGNMESYLAKMSDWALNTTVEKEACPNNLAPTTSTTAQLVMGDALAVCLLKCRNFSDADFARFHPGGALGKRLFLKVGDLCAAHDLPKVLPTASIQEVIMEISQKRLGATAVVNEATLLGVITDGDIRRMLEEGSDIHSLQAEDIMCQSPKSVESTALATEALKIMEANSISQLLVLEDGEYIGIVHIHDILKEGIV